MYNDVFPDCAASLELSPINMKAHFLLAQAEIEVGKLDEAYANALEAYELCSGRGGHSVDKAWERSLAPVTALVLRCKKEIWERREAERLKTRNALLEELVAAIARDRDAELARAEGEAEREEVRRRWAEKEAELRRVWEVVADKDEKRRVVPDWAIDNITFAVMHDPVMVSVFFFLLLANPLSPPPKRSAANDLQDQNRPVLRACLHTRTPPAVADRSLNSRAFTTGRAEA
jgi:STIP1 homology and U-box containing protein 1